MASSASPNTPNVLKGAFVQLAEDFGVIVPNIIPFQLNPAGYSLDLKPWNPFEVDQTNRGANAPDVQPYDAELNYKLLLHLNATDDIEMGDPLAISTGVAARIAALKKLTEPTGGLFGDLIASAGALTGNDWIDADRATVPITLMILGPGTIYPVRITSMSIEVKELTTALYPHMADVSVEVRVLTPETFKCQSSDAIDVAKAAYKLTRTQDDALAVLNIANAVKSAISMLPF